MSKNETESLPDLIKAVDAFVEDSLQDICTEHDSLNECGPDDEDDIVSHLDEVQELLLKLSGEALALRERIRKVL